MPNIIGTTYEDTRNRYVDYIGVATSVSQTFTFDRFQDGMEFRNKGRTTITVTIDGKKYNVPSNSTINIDDKKFIEFDAKTSTGSHAFELKSFSLLSSGGGGTDEELRGEFEYFKSNTNALLAQKAEQADLNTINSVVGNKADKSYTDTQLSLKRDKTTKLVMEDMSEAVVSAITGGATVNVLSVPQDTSVTESKMAISYIMGDIVTGKITINTTNKTIDFAKDDAGNNIVVVSIRGSFSITPTTLTYTDAGINYVFYDRSYATVQIAKAADMPTFITNRNMMMLFSFYHNLKLLTANNKHLFSINGENASIDYLGTGYIKGSLVHGVVTINTSAKTINITKEGEQNIYAIHTKGINSIVPVTLNYTDGGFNYVFLDVTTNSVYVADYSTLANYTNNKKMCMLFAFYSNIKRVYAENRSLYTIDGMKNGGWNETDKTDYDINSSRIVMPDKLYLLKDTPYSILGANILSPLRKWDTSKVSFELPLLTNTIRSSEGVNILISEECELNTQLAVSSEGYTRELFKNLSIVVKDRKNISIPTQPIRILHIGDSLTNASLPPSTKWWLNKWGIPSQMIGTMNNNYVYDYPIPNIPSNSADIKGEGRGGWCITDYTGGRTYTDGSLLMRSGNPFWNPATQAFDAQYYLNNNPTFTGYDFVNIWLGTNDLAYTVENGLKHPNDTVDKPANPVTVADVMAYFTGKLDIMINSFKAVNANVKIAIMPPPHTGKNTVYGERYRTLTDKIVTYYAGREDVVVLGNYMSIGLSAGMQRDINTQPTETRATYSAENNTLLGQNSSNVHFGGHTQLSNAHWIASWIANKL